MTEIMRAHIYSNLRKFVPFASQGQAFSSDQNKNKIIRWTVCRDSIQVQMCE